MRVLSNSEIIYDKKWNIDSLSAAQKPLLIEKRTAYAFSQHQVDFGLEI